MMIVIGMWWMDGQYVCMYGNLVVVVGRRHRGGGSRVKPTDQTKNKREDRRTETDRSTLEVRGINR